eukprot:6974675-Pyramimonas_sp.AAC.1
MRRMARSPNSGNALQPLDHSTTPLAVNAPAERISMSTANGAEDLAGSSRAAMDDTASLLGITRWRPAKDTM